jgi:hypothetical protein
LALKVVYVGRGAEQRISRDTGNPNDLTKIYHKLEYPDRKEQEKWAIASQRNQRNIPRSGPKPCKVVGMEVEVVLSFSGP